MEKLNIKTENQRFSIEIDVDTDVRKLAVIDKYGRFVASDDATQIKLISLADMIVGLDGPGGAEARSSKLVTRIIGEKNFALNLADAARGQLYELGTDQIIAGSLYDYVVSLAGEVFGNDPKGMSAARFGVSGLTALVDKLVMLEREDLATDAFRAAKYLAELAGGAFPEETEGASLQQAQNLLSNLLESQVVLGPYPGFRGAFDLSEFELLDKSVYLTWVLPSLAEAFYDLGRSTLNGHIDDFFRDDLAAVASIVTASMPIVSATITAINLMDNSLAMIRSANNLQDQRDEFAESMVQVNSALAGLETGTFSTEAGIARAEAILHQSIVEGTAEADNFYSKGSTILLSGEAGDDLFQIVLPRDALSSGEATVQRISGGSGVDAVYFDGEHSSSFGDYRKKANGQTVFDKDGFEFELSGVEYAIFEDKTIRIDNDFKLFMISSSAIYESQFDGDINRISGSDGSTLYGYSGAVDKNLGWTEDGNLIVASAETYLDVPYVRTSEIDPIEGTFNNRNYLSGTTEDWYGHFKIPGPTLEVGRNTIDYVPGYGLVSFGSSLSTGSFDSRGSNKSFLRDAGVASVLPATEYSTEQLSFFQFPGLHTGENRYTVYPGIEEAAVDLVFPGEDAGVAETYIQYGSFWDTAVSPSGELFGLIGSEYSDYSNNQIVNISANSNEYLSGTGYQQKSVTFDFDEIRLKSIAFSNDGVLFALAERVEDEVSGIFELDLTQSSVNFVSEVPKYINDFVIAGTSEQFKSVYFELPPLRPDLPDWEPIDQNSKMGTQDNDTFKGTIYEDLMFGRGGSDILTGDLGDDRLDGGAGADFLFGDEFELAHSSDTSAQVYRLYRATLDRAPDANGHKAWTAKIVMNELEPLDAVSGFVNSQEFRNTYGGLNDIQFVEQLYSSVLDRAADEGGLSRWSGQLQDGTLSREQVVLGFSDSREFRNATDGAATKLARESNPAEWSDDVYRLYQATLDREPDENGLVRWTNDLGDGQEFTSVISGFVKSQEFQNTYGELNNSEFVSLLYNNVLDRNPDKQGLAAWNARLDDGAGRAEVVQGFVQSAEFTEKTQSDLLNWIRSLGENDYISGGGGSNFVAGGLLADTFEFKSGVNAAFEVADLERWDYLDFSDFDFSTETEARELFVQVGSDLKFEHDDTTVLLKNYQLGNLADDMFIV